jgi:hypothetical protein
VRHVYSIQVGSDVTEGMREAISQDGIAVVCL